MEVIEREHLRKNLPELLENTVCTPLLLQLLYSMNVIGKSDISFIDAEKYHGVFSQSMRLIDILQCRVGGYEALIVALHSSQQLRSLEILLHDNYKKETRNALKVFTQTGDLDRISSLLQPGKGSLESLVSVLITHDQLIHHCLKNSKDDHPLTIDKKKKIIQTFIQAIRKDSNLNLTEILEAKDLEGRTPLLQENAAPELLTCLMSSGASVFATDQLGNTVLHLATNWISNVEYHQLVQDVTVIDASVINYQNHQGQTPLHAALQHMDLLEKTFNIFEQHKFNFSLVDNRGNSLLHVLALEETRPKALMERVTLSCFQNWNANNNAGKTAMEISKETRNFKMLGVLVPFYSQMCGGKYDNALRICDTEIDKLDSKDSLEATWLHVAKAQIYLKFPNSQAMWATSLKILQACYEIRMKELGQNHPDTVDILGLQAIAYLKLENLNEALKLFEDVSCRQSELLGNENVEVLTVKKGIAAVFTKMGKFSQAENILKEVLETESHLLGEDHLVTLITRIDLANFHMFSGKCNEDVLLCLQYILAKLKMQFGDEHDCTIRTQLSIAECNKRLSASD